MLQWFFKLFHFISFPLTLARNSKNSGQTQINEDIVSVNPLFPSTVPNASCMAFVFKKDWFWGFRGYIQNNIERKLISSNFLSGIFAFSHSCHIVYVLLEKMVRGSEMFVYSGEQFREVYTGADSGSILSGYINSWFQNLYKRGVSFTFVIYPH